MTPDKKPENANEVSTRTVIAFLIVGVIIAIILIYTFPSISKLISFNNTESLLNSWDGYNVLSLTSAEKETHVEIISNGSMHSVFGFGSSEESDIGDMLPALTDDEIDSLSKMFTLDMDTTDETSSLQPLTCDFYWVQDPNSLEDSTQSGLIKYDGQSVLMVIDSYAYEVNPVPFAAMFDYLRIHIGEESFFYFPWLEPAENNDQ